jgi:hypothetical protein
VGERERGKFLSQPVPNPKGQYSIGNSSTSTHGQEQVQAITMLRLGKQVDNQVATPEEACDTTREEENQAKPIANVGPDIAVPVLRINPRSMFPKLRIQKD